MLLVGGLRSEAVVTNRHLVVFLVGTLVCHWTGHSLWLLPGLLAPFLIQVTCLNPESISVCSPGGSKNLKSCSQECDLSTSRASVQWGGGCRPRPTWKMKTPGIQ